MINLFIGQNITDKESSLDLTEFKDMIKFAKSILDNREILPCINETEDDILTLGNSILDLSRADYAIFGKNWKDSRKLSVQHFICEKYEIPIIEYSSKESTKS